MIKSIKNFFFPKKLKSISDKEVDYVIREINESNVLHTVIGIPRERAVYLHRRVMEGFNKYSDVTVLAIEMSKECKHQNELFFVSYLIGREHGREGHITDFMSKMFGKK